MKWLFHLVGAVLANALGLYLAQRYVPGFVITPFTISVLSLLAAILTVLNALAKPLLKLLLGPFILITLGLGIIVINAIILYALDYFSPQLTITTIPALFFGTLIISAVNLVFHIL